MTAKSDLAKTPSRKLRKISRMETSLEKVNDRCDELFESFLRRFFPRVGEKVSFYDTSIYESVSWKPNGLVFEYVMENGNGKPETITYFSNGWTNFSKLEKIFKKSFDSLTAPSWRNLEDGRLTEPIGVFISAMYGRPGQNFTPVYKEILEDFENSGKIRQLKKG